MFTKFVPAIITVLAATVAFVLGASVAGLAGGSEGSPPEATGLSAPEFCTFSADASSDIDPDDPATTFAAISSAAPAEIVDDVEAWMDWSTLVFTSDDEAEVLKALSDPTIVAVTERLDAWFAANCEIGFGEARTAEVDATVVAEAIGVDVVGTETEFGKRVTLYVEPGTVDPITVCEQAAAVAIEVRPDATVRVGVLDVSEGWEGTITALQTDVGSTSCVAV